MNLSAPKKTSFRLAIIFGILGVVGHFVDVPVLSDIDYWLLLVGYAIFFLSTVFTGL